jgi:hypothetical protein
VRQATVLLSWCNAAVQLTGSPSYGQLKLAPSVAALVQRGSSAYNVCHDIVPMWLAPSRWIMRLYSGTSTPAVGMVAGGQALGLDRSTLCHCHLLVLSVWGLDFQCVLGSLMFKSF